MTYEMVYLGIKVNKKIERKMEICFGIHELIN